jgi:hypothetical protein
MSRSQNLHGIAAHLRGRRDLGQEPPVWSPELELAVGLSRDLVEERVET